MPTSLHGSPIATTARFRIEGFRSFSCTITKDQGLCQCVPSKGVADDFEAHEVRTLPFVKQHVTPQGVHSGS